jgi:hypothetical protein
MAGWWFQTCVIFHDIICFKMVKNIKKPPTRWDMVVSWDYYCIIGV